MPASGRHNQGSNSTAHTRNNCGQVNESSIQQNLTEHCKSTTIIIIKKKSVSSQKGSSTSGFQKAENKNLSSLPDAGRIFQLCSSSPSPPKLSSGLFRPQPPYLRALLPAPFFRKAVLLLREEWAGPPGTSQPEPAFPKAPSQRRRSRWDAKRG